MKPATATEEIARHRASVPAGQFELVKMGKQRFVIVFLGAELACPGDELELVESVGDAVELEPRKVLATVTDSHWLPEVLGDVGIVRMVAVADMSRLQILSVRKGGAR